MSLGERLIEQKSVIIKQRRELAELLGFETRNKYAIEDEHGNVLGFAAEQGKGLLSLLWRGFIGHWRSFTILLFDSQRQNELTIHHPFRWYYQRLEITGPGGNYIGALERRFAIFRKRFVLFDHQHRQIMEVNSSFFAFWTFVFERQGQEVGRIEKKWSGLLNEMFTDKDNFRVSFGNSLTKEERLLLLASAFFVDLMYFERKAND